MLFLINYTNLQVSQVPLPRFVSFLVSENKGKCLLIPKKYLIFLSFVYCNPFQYQPVQVQGSTTKFLSFSNVFFWYKSTVSSLGCRHKLLDFFYNESYNRSQQMKNLSKTLRYAIAWQFSLMTQVDILMSIILLEHQVPTPFRFKWISKLFPSLVDFE